MNSYDLHNPLNGDHHVRIMAATMNAFDEAMARQPTAIAKYYDSGALPDFSELRPDQQQKIDEEILSDFSAALRDLFPVAADAIESGQDHKFYNLGRDFARVVEAGRKQGVEELATKGQVQTA